MFKLKFYLETKRKRHDLTPISKSHASSHLFNKMEIRKGTLPFFVLSLLTLTFILYSTFKKDHKRKKKEEVKQKT
jgi:hypothetical protein